MPLKAPLLQHIKLKLKIIKIQWYYKLQENFLPSVCKPFFTAHRRPCQNTYIRIAIWVRLRNSSRQLGHERTLESNEGSIYWKI